MNNETLVNPSFYDEPLLELSEQLRSDEKSFLLNIRFKLMKNSALFNCVTTGNPNSLLTLVDLKQT